MNNHLALAEEIIERRKGFWHIGENTVEEMERRTLLSCWKDELEFWLKNRICFCGKTSMNAEERLASLSAGIKKLEEII